jgi:glycosyltransferase involved in cell wall biosynthesis
MRILLLHNRYQIRGGEDSVVEEESNLLSSHGCEVEKIIVDNDSIHGWQQKCTTALSSLYSWEARRIVEAKLAKFRPSVVHVHNFFPRLSPSIFDAASSLGTPVVQTIHNYRLVCSNGLLFRGSSVCTECVGRAYGWPAVAHACYKGSRLGSATVALMTALHRARKTWKKVARYILLTEFARDLIVSKNILPVDRVVVKPNAVADLGKGQGRGGYALFVGRLSPEKGIHVLLKAWQESDPPVPLKIAGDGPLRAEVEAAAKNHCGIEYVGPVPKDRIRALMQDAMVLLIPSLWCEGLPVVVPEAFSASLPIIASDLGSLATLVTPRETGFLVPPGEANALREAVASLFKLPAFQQKLRTRAREVYEQKYTPELNLNLLLDIYRQACAVGSGVRADTLRRQHADKRTVDA